MILKKFQIILAAVVICTVAALFTAVWSLPATSAATDQCEAAHGMNFVINKVTGKAYLFWSDQYATGSTASGNWTHDIFYQEVDLRDPRVTKKHLLIHAREAQEPASVTCAANGNFFVTFEDGNTVGHGGLSQRYAIYDKGLRAVKAYPQIIALGGHSGHGSCSGSRFVTLWNDEWVDGGGIGNLGTGRDIYVTSMNTDGSAKKTVAISKMKRDWWPLLASTSRHSLLVWQRYVKGQKYSTICYALFDPYSGRLCSIPGKAARIQTLRDIKARYYTYNVTYLPGIRRYVINITTSSNKGIMLLLSGNGKVICRRAGLPPFVRESEPAVKSGRNAATLCYPRGSSGAFFVRVTADKISYLHGAKGTYNWNYRGTSGFFAADGKTACFATLTAAKVKIFKFK